jgi:hypothetical protein
VTPRAVRFILASDAESAAQDETGQVRHPEDALVQDVVIDAIFIRIGGPEWTAARVHQFGIYSGRQQLFLSFGYPACSAESSRSLRAA